MSHTYGSGNSNGNSYLNKKRLEEDNPMDNRYHYDKYPKYEKNVTQINSLRKIENLIKKIQHQMQMNA